MIAASGLHDLDDFSQLLSDALAAAVPELEAAVKDALSRASGEPRQTKRGTIHDSIKHSITGHSAVVGSNDPGAVAREFGTRMGAPRPFLAPTASKRAEAIVHFVATDISDKLGARFD